MRGRKPKPTAIRRADGNLGKWAFNPNEPVPPDGRPTCPSHLSQVAKTEWKRIAGVLYDMGVITKIDSAVLAGYCQAYGRRVEAERKLREGPTLIITPVWLRAAVALARDLPKEPGADVPLHGRARSDST